MYDNTANLILRITEALHRETLMLFALIYPELYYAHSSVLIAQRRRTIRIVTILTVFVG